MYIESVQNFLLFVRTKRHNMGMSVKMGDREAKELMLAANLKPLEPYPGGATPWKCKCLVCGKTVSARLKVIKRGDGGCKFCGRVKAGLSNRISEKDAIKIMKSVGLIPLEPYKNSNTPWKAQCKKCKKIVSPHFGLVKSRGSGCAYCAETRVDPVDAVNLFKSVKLKPLTKYPGNKVPWNSIHIPCGREVSPTYLAIKRGQGPCKFCGRVAVHPKNAEELFLANDLKPIEPYSGDVKKPWRSIHIPCGNQVSPTYNIIQRQESIGCHHCSDQFVDPDEAFQFFMSRDLQPLIPYPGSKKPWKSIHLICGETIQPRYGHIKSGRKGCPVCAGLVPITQERAFAFFRSKGLEPQEKFKGPHHPWKSIHTECGRTVSPRWANVQQNHGVCVYCSGGKVDMKEVRQILKANNLKPLVPYPGNKTGWRCIHLPCGREVAPTYGGLNGGQGPCELCGKNMVGEVEAFELLKRNKYKPLTDFPGGSTPWLAIHTVCGSRVHVRTTYLRRGGKGCSVCAGTKPILEKDAMKLFKLRGFTPLVKFKGAKHPWKSKHNVCGKTVSPSYQSLKSGRGCKYCQIGGINLLAPAFLYLISNPSLNSHKVGIGGFDSLTNRIDQHLRHGWETYRQLDVDTGEEAYEIEQALLDWLRNDLNLQQYLLPEQMPQRGHTETVDASEIDLPTIWAKVEELSRK